MQKLTLSLAALISILLTMTGCKNSDPRDTAIKFLTAVQTMNYDEAKKYATDDSKSMLDALSSFQKMMPASAREKYKNEKFAIKNVQQQGDEATVTYNNTDSSGPDKTLKLKKVNGEWKVAFTKDAMFPDMNGPASGIDSTDNALPADTSSVPADSATGK